MAQRARIAGLGDAPRTGRLREVDHRRILAETLRPPPRKLGVTHWSSRLGARLTISNATVARARRQYGVQPRRAQTFDFSTDAELVASTPEP